MKKVFVILLGIGWMLSQATFAQEGVISFKDWKSQKVSGVVQAISELEDLQKKTPARFGPEETEKLKQAKINLEITKDLNAQDYFVLYLSPRFQNDQNAYAQAVKMMTAEEVAQILLGYDKVIEERRKKNLLPLDNAKFGFKTPKKMEPSQVLSLISTK